MTFQLAISTMHKTKKTIYEMLEKMNVHCDCIIINQCDENFEFKENYKAHSLHVIFTQERGLSRSRNMALKNATADVIAIGDDDLFYFDGFDRTIIEYYEENTDADIVLFNVDSYRKKFSLRETKCSYFALSGYISFQMTMNRNKISESDVMFNTYFGTGSQHVNSGEENIFLSDCFRNGLKIYYCPSLILKDVESESTWFKGFNDRKYVSDRGAIFYALSPLLSELFIVAFAVVKRKILKPISFFESLNLMHQGKKTYLNYIREK